MTVAPNGAGWREHLLLLGKFLRNPRAIGAVAPSSPSLAAAMVQDVDLSGAVRVVELGPGTGALTSALVPRLGPAARVLAIDREPAFIRRLSRQWPRVEGVCASAAALPAIAAERALGPVDLIISGLPFASLPAAVTSDILDGIASALRPGGTFTTFQYVHAYSMRAAVSFREETTRRMGTRPSRRLVVRNLPPAYVLRWSRAG